MTKISANIMTITKRVYNWNLLAATECINALIRGENEGKFCKKIQVQNLVGGNNEKKWCRRNGVEMVWRVDFLLNYARRIVLHPKRIKTELGTIAFEQFHLRRRRPELAPC